jgi:hypothetical protein
VADFLPAGRYAGQAAICAWLTLYSMTRFNALNYPSGVLFRNEAVRRAGAFDVTMQTTGDIDFYFRVLRSSDLIIAEHVGAFVALHPGQSHRATNLDGTAWQEHCALITRHEDLLSQRYDVRDLRARMAAMAFLLGLYRSLSSATRDSARIHRYLARSTGVPLGALLYMTLAFVGARLRWRLRRRLPVRVTHALACLEPAFAAAGSVRVS